MANKILIRRSGTAANVPSSLDHGELAINYADGKLFAKNSSNQIIELSYRDERARAAISVAGAGSYDSNTGVITITGGVTSVNTQTGAVTLTTDDVSQGSTNQYFTNALARGAISVTDSGGDGSLVYNSSTGVITYTGPSAAEVRAHFSAGTGVAISSGSISIGQAVGTADSVSFAALTTSGNVVVGGNLTVNGTTTTVNSTTLDVTDLNITVAKGAASSAAANGAGLTVDGANATITYTHATTSFDINKPVNVAGNIGVTGHILPTTDVTYDLGSNTNRFKDLYLSGSSIKLGTATITATAGGGLSVSQLEITGSNIVFEGTTANNFETTLTVTDPTADRTITLPDVTGTVVTTGDSQTVTDTMLASDAVTTVKILDGNVTNSKLANSTISGVALGNNLNALTISTGLSGSSYDGSGAVTIAIDSTVATLTGTQTLTNKTIAAGSNTISGLTNTNLSGSAGITNANLANSSITINGSAVSLGGSVTIDALPSQTGESGKYLITDGTTASWAALSLSLDGLSDVDTADATDGYILSYNSSTNAWTAEQGVADGTIIDGGNLDGPSSGSGVTIVSDVHNIEDLSDVVLTSPAFGEVLKWNGTNWVNGVDSGGLAAGDLSVNDTGGDGSLTYNSGTGVFTYTGPSASDVRAHFSAGTGISITTGAISIDNTVTTLSGTQTLTNKTLTSPTINAATIGGHLIPSADVTYDLGSASYRFRDLYLSGSTINLGGAIMSTDPDNGTIALIGKPTAGNPNPTALVVTPQGKTISHPTTGGNINFNQVQSAINSNPGFSGSYDDLTNKPDFSAFAHSLTPDTTNSRNLGSSSKKFSNLYATTANVETLNFTGTGPVAISSGNDLNFTATGNITFNGSQLAAVATTGSYNDLSNKPTLTTNLDGLTDVVITSASNGQVLQYNGTNWVNASAAAGGVTSVNSATGAVTLNTDNIGEGSTNQYFTQARARGAISVSGNATYNSSTGVITVTTGGGETAQNITFNNGGSGANSGSSFNGSAAITVSYNTIGAPSTSGTNASGTWGISISGNAATATSATTAGTVTTAAQPSITSLGTLTSVQSNRYSRTVQNLTPAAGTATIDLASGSCIVLTLSNAISGWTLNNVPSGVEFEFRMYIVANGGSISAWPTGTKWALGSAPQITTTTGKIDVVSFTTYDGGTSWIALIAGQNF